MKIPFFYRSKEERSPHVLVRKGKWKVICELIEVAADTANLHFSFHAQSGEVNHTQDSLIVEADTVMQCVKPEGLKATIYLTN